MKTVVGVIVIGFLLFAGAACLDSCRRHEDTRPCLGSSQNR